MARLEVGVEGECWNLTDAVGLGAELSHAVTYQSYAPQQAIAGVVYHPLAKHRALEGWFMEHMRLSGGQIEGVPLAFEVNQISFSKAIPNRINAFHLHPKTIQDELWCVVDGALLVWLVDCREGSPTLGVRRKYLLSSDAPALLHIPSGVAHGYRAGTAGALLVYAMNSQFNPQDPNEGRLPWDYFGPELWGDDRG